MTAQRIAFISPRYSEAGTVGGAETLLKALAERAAAAGREVDFLTTCAQDHFTWENSLPAGVKQSGKLKVHYFPVDARDLGLFIERQTAISRNERLSEAQELEWLKNSVNSSALYEHLREHDYDRIVAGPYLFALTYFASLIRPEKTLLVPCLHDECYAYLGVMKKMFDAVRGCMFNTQPERELAQRLYGYPDAKSRVVGIGMDAFEADPQAFARRTSLTHPYIIYSGRREAGKGTPLLCDYLLAFRQRTGRDVKLVMTGRGPIEAQPAAEDDIIDLGFVSDQEKHEAMAGAVAFVHPSVNESLGIVLLEAWLARTPCLVHAKSEVLRWQCATSNGGLWFRYYAEFEEELSLLLDNAELRRKMGEAGRKYVLDQWSWAKVEQRLFEALDRE